MAQVQPTPPSHTIVPMTSAESSHPLYPPSGATTNSTSRRPLDSGSGSWLRSHLVRLTVNLNDASSQSQPRQSTASFAPNLAPESTTKSVPEVHPPRWFTPEFYFYAVCFAIVFPYMWVVPIRMSSTLDSHYNEYKHYLVPGWMGGRQRDNSDFQYRTFRDSIPVLMGLMSGYLGLSFAIEYIFRKLVPGRGRYTRLASPSDNDPALSTSSPSRRPGRRVFLALFSTVYLLVSHGTNIAKLLACCSFNYLLAKQVAGHRILAPAAIWTFNIGTLYLVHYLNGIPLAEYGWVFVKLEEHTGILTRWQINYNITMLRLVSFALDYHWAMQAAHKDSLSTLDVSNAALQSTRARSSTAHQLSQYTYGNFLLYLFYPPLFIAGPIMTFNDWLHQLHRPPSITLGVQLRYIIRFIVCFMTMEFILHFMYVNAIKDARAWHGDTPMQLSMIGFWNLIIVWLKLLIPWRLFRLWALLDRVDPPENMVRCMANNYSTLGFWRSWHRSYNQWVVRYIYVPVGGSQHGAFASIMATLLVFTFVALWHDLSLTLLTWAWLVTLFVIPEIVGTTLMPAKKYGKVWWYRHLAALGAVGNVLMMMTANLVGFVIGTDGMRYLWQQILGSPSGWMFIALVVAGLWIAIQVMFEYRAEEQRQGILRKF